MSKNAELMSTAPSCFVQDTCPPSVSAGTAFAKAHARLPAPPKSAAAETKGRTACAQDRCLALKMAPAAAAAAR